MLERLIFWSLLILISAYLLRKFYFSASAEKMKRLRYTALATEIVALALFYFSWIPKFISGDTGSQLVAAGNADVIVVFGLIAGAIFVFIQYAALNPRWRDSAYRRKRYFYRRASTTVARIVPSAF